MTEFNYYKMTRLKKYIADTHLLIPLIYYLILRAREF